jgi:hypothetical protein
VITATEFLRAITTYSGALHLRADSIENTSYVLRIIADELRYLYTMGYYSSNDQKDGQYRTISVGVNVGDLVVRTRAGYRAPKEETDNNEPNATAGKPPVQVKP